MGTYPIVNSVSQTTTNYLKPIPTTALLYPNLQSELVSQLQILLAKDPAIYPEAKITGFYGPSTKAAVARFQQKYGIPTTVKNIGLAGPLTLAKINSLYATKKAVAYSIFSPIPVNTYLYPGQRSEPIKQLQVMLSQDPTIYTGQADGFYSTSTKEAVARFQKKYKIPTNAKNTGLAGPLTLTKLNSLYAK